MIYRKYIGLLILFALCCNNEVVAQYYTSNTRNINTQPSNLNTRAFCQDSLGYMWVATFRGLNRYNGYEFIQYFHNKHDSLSIENDQIISLFLDSKHRLWVGTSIGVSRYDFETDSFKSYTCTKGKCFVYSFFEDRYNNINVSTSIGAGVIDFEKQHLFIDSANRYFVNWFEEDDSGALWMGLNENLAWRRNHTLEYIEIPDNKKVTCVYKGPQKIWWLGTNAGLILFDPALKLFKNAPKACLSNDLFSKTHINFIKEIGPLKILIGTESQGLFEYDILGQNLTHSKQDQSGAFGSDQLISCYVDNQENVWAGSFDRGFSVWKRYLDYFNTDHKLSNAFKDKFVTRIVEDIYGGLWISTRYNGLFHYSLSGKLTQYDAQNSDLYSDNNYLIESIFIDSNNRIWIGLVEELLMCTFTEDGKLTVKERKKIKRVSTMAEVNKNLWVGGTSGLHLLKTGSNGIETELIYNANIPDICVLKSGELLFSSFNRGLFYLHPDTKEIKPYILKSKEAIDISKHCITLYEDSEKRLWVGSYGNGMLCIEKNIPHIFTINDGLPSNDVLCFREDKLGDMWISTSYGISKFKITDSSFVNYFSNDGTLGNQFHEKSGLIRSDGSIFFTGNHGLTFFNPLAVLPNKYPPKIHLDDLKIMNQSVKPAEKGSVLTKSISFTNQIELTHKHSVVSFDYSGIDFLAPQKITYAYKLEGFDEVWNNVGNYRRATYSNLSPGKYVFMVKAINGDGLESEQPAILHITVKSAPWFSWYAWVFYFMILLLVLFSLFRLWFKIKMGKRELMSEHIEREREREMTEMKITFFTNISHELRTPLTLISGPLEQLLSNRSIDDSGRNLLSTVSRNVSRLLQLMNQLLDFNKMENGMLALKVQNTDIIKLISNIKERFEYLASEKQITFIINSEIQEKFIWVDTDKFEKILYNLLSNAFKHTQPKGTVIININYTDRTKIRTKYNGYVSASNFIEISVTDTGIGVPPEKLDELFVRYRQIEFGDQPRPNYGGTGIGLHFTKRLVETHNGLIRAEIMPEKGMNFSFIIPSDDVYSNSEKETENDILIENYIEKQSAEVVNKAEDHLFTILIAEDNTDLMIFLRSILCDKYELIETANGAEALKIMEEEVPDLILTDVIMPEMSGYELCAAIKQKPALSHIPVIMLTAKSTMEDNIEGLELGANAYIYKPFHVDYLLLTIKNLLNYRDQLRLFYTTPHPHTNDSVEMPVKLNKLDEEFLEKLTNLLEKELGNYDLNINYVARELAFSRTGFYRKLKGLTSMSPIDFFRTYRLRRAAEMIVEGSLTLNEIAESTGFGTYSYFSVAFKKHFGVSPKDYNK